MLQLQRTSALIESALTNKLPSNDRRFGLISESPPFVPLSSCHHISFAARSQDNPTKMVPEGSFAGGSMAVLVNRCS